MIPGWSILGVLKFAGEWMGWWSKSRWDPIGSTWDALLSARGSWGHLCCPQPSHRLGAAWESFPFPGIQQNQTNLEGFWGGTGTAAVLVALLLGVPLQIERVGDSRCLPSRLSPSLPRCRNPNAPAVSHCKHSLWFGVGLALCEHVEVQRPGKLLFPRREADSLSQTAATDGRDALSVQLRSGVAPGKCPFRPM